MFEDKEDGEVPSRISLAQPQVEVLAVAMALFQETEERSAAQGLHDLVSFDVVLRLKLLDDIFQPYEFLYPQGPISGRSRGVSLVKKPSWNHTAAFCC